MAQRKGLGKGLDALIPGGDLSMQSPSDGTNSVSIDFSDRTSRLDETKRNVSFK